MPLSNDGKAPYAPAGTLTDIIEKYRNRGLATPFTADVLTRAGVTDSLLPRVLATLKQLDLIDEDGKPTAQLDLLRKAPSADYKERVAEWVRAVYAPIFQFVDPATATAEAIEDTFRVYEPAGQRGRMVTLFSGLCAYAGIVDDAPTKKRGPAKGSSPAKAKPKPKPTPNPNGQVQHSPPPPPLGGNGSPSAFTRTIKLPSGGAVMLTVEGNPLGFASSDREFVFSLVDKINAHRDRQSVDQEPDP